MSENFDPVWGQQSHQNLCASHFWQEQIAWVIPSTAGMGLVCVLCPWKGTLVRWTQVLVTLLASPWIKVLWHCWPLDRSKPCYLASVSPPDACKKERSQKQNTMKLDRESTEKSTSVPSCNCHSSLSPLSHGSHRRSKFPDECTNVRFKLNRLQDLLIDIHGDSDLYNSLILPYWGLPA